MFDISGVTIYNDYILCLFGGLEGVIVENYKRYVIKTIVFAVMLVVMLGLAAGAGAACNHANSYTVLVQSATCCEPGWYDLVCSDCGATVQEGYNEMPATGRHDDTQVQVKSPLCETDGEARFYCNVSGKLVKTEKIDNWATKWRASVWMHLPAQSPG